MKIRNITQFQDALDKEIGWRKKEIIDLKSSVSSSGILPRPTLIRAGTALLYAHWEGFIKNSSILYVYFINGKRVKYSNLKSPFIVMGLKNYLKSLSGSGNYDENAKALDFIRENMNEWFSINNLSVVKTDSNLSSKVFANIATSLCIPVNNYEPRFNFIDESLVARRNKIAHGEYIDINADEWRRLADEVLFLLANYKTDLENAASCSTFQAEV